MNNRSYNAELQDAIQLLEAEQAAKLKLMKEHFQPANLLSVAVGLAAGYAVKKAITGQSNNKLRKFLGVILQLGIANIIAQNPKTIRSFGQYISNHIFHKEE